ncbi:MAG TPA: condensation domain-containing protein [Ktedonobacteraceae bacterium]|nr:condensation domain-containing protein [Ktedonobacteraceae bacterium]
MTREDVAYFPLSLAQEGMWLAHQITPTSAAYNVPYLLGLTGPVQKEFLARALADIIARHEILRTTFAFQDNSMVQVVTDTLPLPYGERDFRNTPDPAAAMRQFATEEARCLFDLATGPLIKVWLLQTGEENHQLLLVLHHMICDGWSMEVFLQELSELYTSYSEARTHHLSPLPIHYADFAVWERQWLQGAVRDARVTYWQQTLAGAPALLTLATDYPRPPVQTLQGADYLLELPCELAERLVVLGQSEQCTLFMTLLAAFQATLYRWTGQSDIVIGSPMANRTRPELQKLIGLFTNMLPLRNQLAPDLAWRQLLQQTHTAVLAASAHQELPFEELVKAVQPARSAGASPCFQVAFSLQQSDQETLCLPGIEVKTLDLHNGTSKFDLTLHMHYTPDRFTGTLIYNTSLFAASTIQHLAAYIQAVLEYVAEHPDAHIAALPSPPQRPETSHLPHTSVPEAMPPQEAPEAPASASQHALEQIIVEIWQRVLGFSEIEMQDNFFDLGGYSLLMIQVQRQLQEVLQIQIPLTDLLRFPTIQTLATFLSQGFDEVPALLQRRERGRARDEALHQQRARRQAQHPRHGGTHE